ncbi:MAG: DNA polymerase III subunit gamma/tau [Clostridia bacterium]|nr:DNA polymerase III subunit gamma/tau [Clostridia bacterium]
MEYQALYRRWRPLTFDDIVGQKHVAQTIKNEVASQNVGHAFLFCGTRGTGKTSTARILSRAINCTNNKDGNPCNECESCKGILSGSIMDVVEIDAASNSGVANIRSLRDEANYAAASVRYKVYIIDEVHALSKDAFNALLKLLEEPPEHVKFVLATTEANKVLDTIASRCQRFDFNKITKNDIFSRLDEICEAEMIQIEPEAIRMVAEAADGSLRDALSILEPCISSGKIVETEYVKSLLGFGEKKNVAEVCLAVSENNGEKVLDIIEEVCASGRNLNPFVESLIKGFRNIMVYAITRKKPLNENDEDWERLLPAADNMGVDKAILAVNVLSEAYSKAKYMSFPRYLIEASLLKLCNLREEGSMEALEARIGELEKKIARGISVAPESIPAVKEEKKEESIKKEAEKPRAKTKKIADSEAVAKIKEKWPEIMSAIAMGGSLNLYMALENSSLRSFGEKVAIVFPDGVGAVLRDMIEGGLSEIKEIILSETGLDAELTVKMESDFDANENNAGEVDPFDEIASLPWVNN